ncbi:putative membrane protein [Pedobacter sp. UYEF25]
MENQNTFQQPIEAGDGKMAGIVSYLTIVGWLIAYFALHKDKETPLGRYQLRQTLLFHIVSMVVSWGAGILFGLLFFSVSVTLSVALIRVVQLALLILWIIGFIGAVQGEQKPIPLIGLKAQTLFSTI